MGMCESSASQRLSHHCPTMFRTNTPVRNTATTMMSTPSPGTLRRRSSQSSAGVGNTEPSAPTRVPNTPLAMPAAHSSTQTVMASGSQTRMPAIRNFFTCVLRASPGGGASVAGAGCAAAAGGRAGRLGRGGGGGSGRRGGLGGRGRGVRRRGAGALGAGAGAVAEVGHVPARALELEAGRGDLLAKRAGAAGGADFELRVGELLQHVLRVTAGFAAIGVDRHGTPWISNRKL